MLIPFIDMSEKEKNRKDVSCYSILIHKIKANIFFFTD